MTEEFDWNEEDTIHSSSLHVVAISGSREIGMNSYKVLQEAVSVPGLQGISPLRGPYEHVILCSRIAANNGSGLENRSWSQSSPNFSFT
jgi:hypothetical protein